MARESFRTWKGNEYEVEIMQFVPARSATPCSDKRLNRYHTDDSVDEILEYEVYLIGKNKRKTRIPEEIVIAMGLHDEIQEFCYEELWEGIDSYAEEQFYD